VIPPANDVAAPIDNAVATAGAMCVIDWNRTSGSPIASRSSDGAAPPIGRSFTVIPNPPFLARRQEAQAACPGKAAPEY
jgi:hypothetical protein